MDSFSIEHRDPALLANAGRRHFGAALTQLALNVALILSIVVVLAVASASSVMAQARTDLMVMEENTTTLTTGLIVAVIFVVMGLLTILAIRDASPKRGSSRRTTPYRR